MLDRLPRAKRNWALAIIGVLLLWLCWRIREVLNPLVLGYLLAFIVHPAVMSLQSRGWSRRRAVNLIFIGAGLASAVITLALVVQGARLSRQLAKTPILEQLGAAGERLADSIRKWLPEEVLPDDGSALGSEGDSTPDSKPDSTPDSTPDSKADGEANPTGERNPGADTGAGADPLPVTPGGTALAEVITEVLEGETVGPEDEGYALGVGAADAGQDAGLLQVLRDLWTGLSDEQAAGASSYALRRAGGLWASLRHWFGSLVGLGFLLVLLPVYTYFLLFELGRIHGFVARYIPVRERSRVKRIGHQIGEVIANFFRGRLIVCFLKGVVLTLGLALMGVDYALLLGMGSGFLSLVPFVGPLIGFLLAFILAMTAPGAGLLAVALRTALVFVVAEVFEGYYLVPKILGESLGLHPVVVLVSVFAGGALLGMFGFLIALPLTAAIVILVREFVLPALADFADEDAIAGPAKPDASI